MDHNTNLAFYKVMADTITASERRRQQASSFYLTIIAALIAVSGSEVRLNPIILGLIGFFVSLLWFASIRYFRALAKAKFDVIADIESHFDYRPFNMEWDYFNNKHRKGRVFGLGLSTIETALPLLAILVSLFAIVSAVAFAV